uniref:G-protein coupled receptors family 1 profile domain-containing protein n=1 Tax=Panagrolaimus sp. ES5 TaxID=591445 RepID=A0AC34G991_9BILA
MAVELIFLQNVSKPIDSIWPNVTCENDSPWPSCLSLGTAFVTIAFMLIVMLVIVLGNLLVVLTVNNDHKLRSQRQNWLIVSLAIADLLVGLLVMPLTMTYEIIGVWVLGDILCELWLALDVLFVTASILHICIISLDRYWSVTQPLTYPSKRTPTRITIMIGVAWSVSLLICMPPILGWRQPKASGECSVSNELGYVLYSSLGSFYIPVIILMMVYWRIFAITKHHSRQRLKETERTDKTLCQMAAASRLNAAAKFADVKKDRISAISPSSTPLIETTLIVQKDALNGYTKNPEDNINGSKIAISINGTSSSGDEIYLPQKFDNNNTIKVSPEKKSSKVKQTFNRKLFEFNSLYTKRSKWMSSLEEVSESSNGKKPTDKRRKLLKAKERQATMLLGLILTAFIASWLPFFVLYVLGAFSYEAPTVVFKFFFWLGYCNSGINPVIYTVFNREFKRALCRQLRRQQRAILSFWEHFA